ncbi:hypothetical protein SynNOUM97013_02091 [Synechococcus sp. NOUM97013]|nr:hypothetical protein SynNOUM97013_02091 [Synechococcus sp. NOUM97013]
MLSGWCQASEGNDDEDESCAEVGGDVAENFVGVSHLVLAVTSSRCSDPTHFHVNH